MRAECCRGVHACVLRVTLGNVRRGVCLGSHFHCNLTPPRFSVELPQKTNGDFFEFLVREIVLAVEIDMPPRGHRAITHGEE